MAFASTTASDVSSEAGQCPVEVDLLLLDGFVVTADSRHSCFCRGGVAVLGSRIVEVGPSAVLKNKYQAKRTLDAARRLIVPGFINAHSHPAHFHMRPGKLGQHGAACFSAHHAYSCGTGAFEARNPGFLAQGGNYDAFLRDLVQMCRHGYDEETTYLNTLRSLMIEIRGGATCYVDGAAGATMAVVQAQTEIGMRGIVTRTAGDLALDSTNPSAGLVRIEDAEHLLAESSELSLRINRDREGLTRFWYNLFTDCSASDELIQGMGELARRDGVGIASHTATIRNHDTYSLRHFGKRGIDRLEQLGVLGPNWLGAHMGFVNEGEIERMARLGCKVVHVPGTAMLSGKGIIANRMFPRMIDAGIVVGLGNDIAVQGDMTTEAQRTFLSHKDAWMDDRVMPANAVFEMMTIHGARCCLWDQDIGSLEAGKKADITLIDIDSQRYFGGDPLERFLTHGSCTDVRTVVIDGRVVLDEGEFVTLDERAINQRIRERYVGRES